MSYLLIHNPKCSKSRQMLELLNEKQVEFQVREYLKDPLNQNEILELMDKLEDEDQKRLVRVKEEEYKNDPFSLTDKKVIAQKISDIPKLLERPILISENQRAVIARPVENAEKLF